MAVNKSFLQLNNGMNVVINKGLMEIGHEITEADFKNYGMSKTIDIDLYAPLSKKSFVIRDPSLLLSGKIYKKIIDTNSFKIKKILRLTEELKELTYPRLNGYSNNIMSVTASSEYRENKAYRAFDSSTSTLWQPDTFSRYATIKLFFKKPVIPKRCTMSLYHKVQNVSLQMSGDMGSEYGFSNNTERTYINSPINEKNKKFSTFTWTLSRNDLIHGINDIKLYGFYNERILIKQDNVYKYYKEDKWVTLKDSVDEIDFELYGNEPESIPEEAWKQIYGEIEINQYIDSTEISGASITFETETFTLAEEFNDQTIKIIEYTNNPEQEDSTIILETEPFAFYDEVGDSFDVLYYTDDPDKTEAELEINHNHSPLDDLDGDFELVTWTMEEEAEVQEELKPVFKEKIEDGDLYGVTVDLSKGTINIK
ncbi:hypothetical protein L3476_29065 [Paenibacillus thiaminolyticus]|uniref:hypothetical protein n=1 Tax=Paenibacillus thiaminolyticus TaxID=49283 RepID=UPI0011634594|nr:hypothetical protein [Paenibacillus thiaminolyticus]NGP57653.1 hypothetical protein [Paenibacillus thiaminolyticus]WCR27169.1 hypothetical protein L3476_29065 [Paenibacillus thiaminolyticus]